MNFKKLALATSLALAAFSAAAVPLDQVTGSVEIKLGGLTTETRQQAGTNETTWGVGYISDITPFAGTGDWKAGSGDYLYYMIYGIADLNIIPRLGGGFDVYNVGATNNTGNTNALVDGKIHLDIYKTSTKISSIDTFKNANPALRTGYNSYSAFAGLGPAYLQLTFGAGVVADDRTEAGFYGPTDERASTLYQVTSDATLPTSGTGVFFADVVGGTAMSAWDTNGQDFGHDMAGNFTIRPNYGSKNNPNCTVDQVRAGVCFAGLINDPIVASKIPEPGSLALFGLALAGLAGVSRRKQK